MLLLTNSSCLSCLGFLIAKCKNQLQAAECSRCASCWPWLLDSQASQGAAA